MNLNNNIYNCLCPEINQLEMALKTTLIEHGDSIKCEKTNDEQGIVKNKIWKYHYPLSFTVVEILSYIKQLNHEAEQLKSKSLQQCERQFRCAFS